MGKKFSHQIHFYQQDEIDLSDYQWLYGNEVLSLFHYFQISMDLSFLYMVRQLPIHPWLLDVRMN